MKHAFDPRGKAHWALATLHETPMDRHDLSALAMETFEGRRAVKMPYIIRELQRQKLITYVVRSSFLVVNSLGRRALSKLDAGEPFLLDYEAHQSVRIFCVVRHDQHQRR